MHTMTVTSDDGQPVTLIVDDQGDGVRIDGYDPYERRLLHIAIDNLDGSLNIRIYDAFRDCSVVQVDIDPQGKCQCVTLHPTLPFEPGIA